MPSFTSAIEIANSGMPCRKLVVPSSGSTTHSCDGSLPRTRPRSSIRKPNLGRAFDNSWCEDFFGAPVGGGDEIRRPLERDLQILDLAEIADQRARRLARGGDHHGDEGRAEHCCLDPLPNGEG